MPGTGDYAITSFDCTLNFTDYVCAGILDPAASPSFAAIDLHGASLRYMVMNMSGTFQNFAWAANGAGVTLGAGAPGNDWALITSGAAIDTSVATTAWAAATQTFT